MTADILNRPWKLSRRSLLASAAIVPLAACGVIDLATLGQVVAGDVQQIASALSVGLTGLGALGELLPAGWTDVLALVSRYVGDISAIAGGISSATLVSTAGGGIANLIHDFNQIVQAIVANPVIATLVAGTGFGWALYVVPALLTLIEQAVKLVISIAQPPVPVQAPPAAARLRAVPQRRRIVGPVTPELARVVLAEVIATGS